MKVVKYLDGVVLKEESGTAYTKILLMQCPNCIKAYRLPFITGGQTEANMPKYCPYCGKKLVKKVRMK